MTECLVALGSNVGDRPSVLNAAIDRLAAEPGVVVARRSTWYSTQPVGGAALVGEFLNGVALVETSREPEKLLELLQQIELQHGRERHERWANRSLDLDLLLYGDRIVESPRLTLPHPRMSFRRFVLDPAVEIAPDMIHPLIGWSLAQLVRHLDEGADSAAIVAPDEGVRSKVVELLTDQFGARSMETCDNFELRGMWPTAMTSWLAMPRDKARPEIPAPDDPAAAHPKLTILIDSPGILDTKWNATIRQPGRGPTLNISAANRDGVTPEVLAAVQAVWPHLGPLAD